MAKKGPTRCRRGCGCSRIGASPSGNRTSSRNAPRGRWFTRIGSIQKDSKRQDDSEAFADAPRSEAGDAGVIVDDVPIRSAMKGENFQARRHGYNYAGKGGGKP
ncbi:MAG: hypothetical protein IJ601_12615 [Acidaminococcaceae bacterium]|nr:hypothetical protein [Acidaminococcaceae bacterium]